MGFNCPSTSYHQNCQPLQAGAPWSWAPTWWIEPRQSAAIRVPSARTLAVQRRLALTSSVPGARKPRSTSQPKGMRGSSRRARMSTTAASAGMVAANRLRAAAA